MKALNIPNRKGSAYSENNNLASGGDSTHMAGDEDLQRTRICKEAHLQQQDSTVHVQGQHATTTTTCQWPSSSTSGCCHMVRAPPPRVCNMHPASMSACTQLCHGVCP